MLVYGKCACFVMQLLYVCVCAYPVTVLNDAFCMTCSLLIPNRDIVNGCAVCEFWV